jgi:hypothetical protein
MEKAFLPPTKTPFKHREMVCSVAVLCEEMMINVDDNVTHVSQETLEIIHFTEKSSEILFYFFSNPK